MSDSIFQETGIAVPIASRKYSVCYNDCIHVHTTYIHFALSMKKKKVFIFVFIIFLSKAICKLCFDRVSGERSETCNRSEVM